MNSMVTGRSSRMMRRTSSSIARSSSSVSAAVEREVEAQVVRRARASPPGGRRSPTTLRSARWSRCVPVWLRIVCGAPVGVDDRLDRLADPQPAVERAAMDDQAADRLLGVVDREQLAAAARLAEDALVADLAAALGVERRPVEDDLGLAVAGQLVELHPVADDRDDPSLGGRRLVAEERRVAGARLDRAVQRGELGVLRRARAFVPGRGCARAARRARRRSRRGRRRRRTRRRARRSGRSGSRTCRGAGTRRRRGAPARRRAGPPARRPTTRSRAGQRRSSASSSWPRARRRASARTGASSRSIAAEDLVAPLDEVRVRLAHRRR